MKILIIVIVIVVVVVVVVLIGAAMSVRVVKQHEPGVPFRLGKVLGARTPGLRVIVAFIDVLHRVSLRIEDDDRHRRARSFPAGEKAAAPPAAAPPGAVMRVPIVAANGATDAS